MVAKNTVPVVHKKPFTDIITFAITEDGEIQKLASKEAKLKLIKKKLDNLTVAVKRRLVDKWNLKRYQCDHLFFQKIRKKGHKKVADQICYNTDCKCDHVTVAFTDMKLQNVCSLANGTLMTNF